jgi:hypothetical protein
LSGSQQNAAPNVLGSIPSYREGGTARGEPEGLDAHDGYRLPGELARHAPKERFAPDELRGVCRAAGKGPGPGGARPASVRRRRWLSCGATWICPPRLGGG